LGFDNPSWVATRPVTLQPPSRKYLASLGRIAPEKRVDIAIDSARRVGIPLKLAAKVDAVDRDYFETIIKPLLSPPDIEYLGEVSESEKSEFLGGALALMLTIDWLEPFGLAMIEAMACGTPVIARRCGSTPAVVADGVSGYLASSIEELVQAARTNYCACFSAFKTNSGHRRTSASFGGEGKLGTTWLLQPSGQDENEENDENYTANPDSSIRPVSVIAAATSKQEKQY
jgi:hypothetical protein